MTHNPNCTHQTYLEANDDQPAEHRDQLHEHISQPPARQRVASSHKSAKMENEKGEIVDLCVYLILYFPSPPFPRQETSIEVDTIASLSVVDYPKVDFCPVPCADQMPFD